jgi:hypothetical protein
LKLHLHHFSKIKIQKESQNSRNQGFSYYFCMMTEGSGSGSWRPKNTWIRWIRIRIRIRNTDGNPDRKTNGLGFAISGPIIHTNFSGEKNPQKVFSILI